MDTLTHPPTDEQLHILDLLRSTSDNLLINALAGCGKTSTLEMIQNVPSTPVLCLAFNRGVASTMESQFRPTTLVRTFNSLGHRIWSDACTRRLTVNPKKVADILRAKISELPSEDRAEAWERFWDIVGAVGFAKSIGYVVEGTFPSARSLCGEAKWVAGAFDEEPNEMIVDLAKGTLIESTKEAYGGHIDFNDQVYMPALFGGTYPKFPLVLVDEAQDLSPINHAMLHHMRRSRIVAVGDPNQSIYAFRGAVRDGMSQLAKYFCMGQADLSLSFRCPEAIVRNVHWHVPNMRWSKPGGEVVHLNHLDLSSFPDPCTIICRNNSPLFALAFRLLSSGRSVSVGGSDVGPRLLGIMRKLGPEELSREQLLGAINDWEAEKIEKESKSARDLAACMRVFASHGANLRQALGYADDLFKRSGTITLLTGHKAKGLEWPVVYHLDPWLIGDGDQEDNLRYVISTRAQEAYYEIDSENIQW